MTDAPPRPPARSRRRRSPGDRLLWGLFLLADLPLLVAVVAGLAAGYLHPGPFWWAQLCAAFLPYLALALAAAAALPLFTRRWGWLAAHALPLVLVAARAFPVDLVAAPREARPGDLVLMTFNVPQRGPSAEVLGDSMVALTRAVRPDLLALQEAAVYGRAEGAGRFEHEPPHVAAVADRIGYDVVAPHVPPGATEVPVLVHAGAPADSGAVEVLEAEDVEVGLQGDEDATQVVRVRFRWHGREAVLYNVHLRSYGVAKPWHDPALDPLAPGTWLPYLRGYRAGYRARAPEVEALVERVAAETLPTLVAGDFNEAPSSWAYRQLRSAGADRADAFLEAGEGDGRTYHSRRPIVRIDHVLADPAFEVTAARVRATTFSDHRPLVVRLRWRDQPGGPG